MPALGRRWTVPLACLLTLTACAQPNEPRPQPSSPTTPQNTSTPDVTSSLDCNVIDTSAPTTDYRVIADTVALDTQELPLSQQGGDGRFDKFGKTGLGVRTGSDWTVSVAPESRSHLRINWGSPGRISVEIRPPQCPRPSTASGWAWYPGGYWVDEPGCYAVNVTVEKKTTPVRIAVGASCD